MARILNSVTEINSKDFDINWIGVVGYGGFISDYNNRNLNCRIYDDACDEGFVLVSSRTGAKRVFNFAGYDYNNEGEIEIIRYASNMKLTAARNGVLADDYLTLEFFND